MVGEPRTIVRPIELSRAFQIWPGLAAQRWYGPYADLPAFADWLASPKRDQGAVGRESQNPDRGIDELQGTSASKVMELSRTGLCDPDISRSISPRQKCHELAVPCHSPRLLVS